MQIDKPDFTPDAEGARLAKVQEKQRRHDVLNEFRDRVCSRPRRKRFYAATIARREGKLTRRPNPNRARHLRPSWELQHRCAVMGWLQLINGKENVKVQE